jgi:hypothetical protein
VEHGGVPELLGQARPREEALVDLMARADPANVARFLAAMGDATEVPRRSLPRGPRFWKSRVLRRHALGDEDDAQGCSVPHTS